MEGRELELENTFAVADESALTHDAALIASLSDSWLSDAAALLAPALNTGVAPLIAKFYDATRGFGYATWHYGGDLLTICYGQSDILIAKSDLTDTERESLLLQSRRKITSGAQVLAIAHTRTVPQPSESDIARESGLTLDGCLAFAYKNRV